MKRLPTPAEMEARLLEIAQRRNARTPEEGLKNQEPHGFLVGSKPGDHETRSLISFPTRKVFDSTVSTDDVVLLERYGDIMGVVDNHPAFVKTIEQWGVWPQSLTQACKTHGVAKVLDAIRYTANYHAAKKKGSFLFAVLRQGKRSQQ